MRTILKTIIKDNTHFYIKETIPALNKLLLKKVGYIIVTKVKFNNQKKVLSERKVVIKKSTILIGDRVS